MGGCEWEASSPNLAPQGFTRFVFEGADLGREWEDAYRRL